MKQNAVTARWIFGAAFAVLAAAACNPSPHIDPPGSNGTGATAGTGGTGGTSPTTGGGGTSTSSGGGGAGGSTFCDSNADCGYLLPLCDVPSHQCVECLVQADCAEKGGTVCSKAACVCPDDLDFCEADGTGVDRCVDRTASTKDCGSCGHACFDKCIDGACAEPWEPLNNVDAPSARWEAASVWTGSSMIVWGGQGPGGVTDTGGIYDSMTGKWEATPTSNAPSPRRRATAVWTGTKMVVFGGIGASGEYLANGGVFNPTAKSWDKLPDAGVPTVRGEHVAVWAANRMLVWGGYNGTDGNLDSGASTDLGIDWIGLGDPAGVITRRRNHSAVWTGTDMIVFGGIGFDPGSGIDNQALGDGAFYSPGASTWNTPISNIARYNHTAVWTGTAMIVFGGHDAAGNVLANTGRYDAVGGWVNTEAPSADARVDHTALWFGAPVERMIVWGGVGPGGPLATGRAFNPTTVQWNAKALPDAPKARSRHIAVAAPGSKMIIWGGKGANGAFLNDGAILDLTKVQ